MATKVQAGADLKRTDMFLVNPFEIEVLEASRGRITPPTEAAIIHLAMSIFDHGQQQPVQCRRVEGQRLQLTMGYTRIAALRLIRDGFVGSDTKERRDESARIQVVIHDVNNEKALTDNIIENRHRNQTTPIDDAHNQNQLRDRYGYDDEHIAQLYDCTVVSVRRTQKLLRLEKSEQMLVHEGKMSMNAALDLLELHPNVRAAVIRDALAEGHVNAADIRSQVRDHHLNDNSGGKRDPKNAGPKPKIAVKARTGAEIKKFFESEGKGRAKHAPFAKLMVTYVAGLITDDQMRDQMKRAFANRAA